VSERRELGWYARIFGTGPRGLALSWGLLALVWWLAPSLAWPPIHGNAAFGLGALLATSALTAAGVAWSLKSLPPGARGRKMVTAGALHYVRHPFYASFLLSADFGFALWLDHWIYVIWAAALLPLWSVNVIGEERLMRDVFGAEYADYCRRTGRFIPRLSAFRG